MSITQLTGWVLAGLAVAALWPRGLGNTLLNVLAVSVFLFGLLLLFGVIA